MMQFKKLNLNHILFLTIIVLFIFLIKQTYITFCKSQYALTGIEKISSLELETTLISKAKPFSYYEKIFKDRDLFKISLSEENPENLKESFLKNRLPNYKLLGIISSGDKSQALINNRINNSTFTCLAGDIIGKFTVKKVLLDRVILQAGDELLELKL